MIDFAIPDDIKQTRSRVSDFIEAHVLPAEQQIGTRPYFAIVAGLQAEARAAGLWCPFIPAEWGGMEVELHASTASEGQRHAK